MTIRHEADLARLAACALLAVLALSACSSPTRSKAAAAVTGTESTCEQAGAVLSDGPDPDADPVGYAEAQILPLRQIRAMDQALGTAIRQLADAYQKFYVSDGKSSPAKEAVTVASAKVNSFCPGAAS